MTGRERPGPRQRALQDPTPHEPEKSQQNTGAPELGVTRKIQRKAREWGIREIQRTHSKEGGFPVDRCCRGS